MIKTKKNEGSHTDVTRLVQINTGTTVECPSNLSPSVCHVCIVSSRTTARPLIQHFALEKSAF